MWKAYSIDKDCGMRSITAACHKIGADVTLLQLTCNAMNAYGVYKEFVLAIRVSNATLDR
jgi:hypothetical protein